MVKSLKRMPTLFIGHGSPMNGIEHNDFTETLVSLGKRIPKPRAILCVSAHWMSEGTWLTHMNHPRTIHDFHGFPKELFEVQYPAPSSPEIADLICKTIQVPNIHPDKEIWGFDHGAWTVLRHMYPNADIPLLQLSIYMEQPGDYHFKLGQALRTLRDQGILIIGSGNVVHNLRRISWEANAPSMPFASEFDAWIKEKIEARDFNALVNESTRTEAGRLSIPTPDHYYPLLYVLGASDSADQMKFEYEGIQNGSISMRSVSFGLD